MSTIISPPINRRSDRKIPRSPTNKAVWMLIGGIVTFIVSLTMTLRSSKQG